MKRTGIWVSLTVLVLAVVAAAVYYYMRPQASIVNEKCGPNAITVYKNTNYDAAGEFLCLLAGEYNQSYFLSKGFTDNTISSIEVGEEAKATLFWNDLGSADQAQKEITASLKDLTVLVLSDAEKNSLNDPSTILDANWNDDVSAIKVENSIVCASAVYDDINYGLFGTCLPVGKYSQADLAAKGISNNDISSVKVNVGYKVTLYDKSYTDPAFNNYLSSSVTMTEDVPDLRTVARNGQTVNFNNVASSVEVAVVGVPTTPAGACTADINQDGFVNVADQTLLFSAWTDAR